MSRFNRARVLSLISAFGLVGALLLVAAVPASATTSVDCNANSSALQPAIDAASPGSTLAVTGTCVGHFTIAKDLTLQGSGGAKLDGTSSGTTLTISSGTVVVDGIAITNGHAQTGGGVFNSSTALTLTNSAIQGDSADLYGGAIYNNGGGVTLTNDTVSGGWAGTSGGGIYNSGGTVVLGNSTVGNSAEFGGGVFNAGGSLTVTNTTIRGQADNSGGGIYNTSAGTFTITGSAVSGLTGAANGGGIYNAGTGTMTNATVGSSQAHELGGGIYNVGTLTLTGSTVSGSIDGANYGGGIASEGGSLSLTNSTVSGNSAATAGGIYNRTGTLTLTNSTVSANTSFDGGGGIFEDVGTGTVTLRASILAGNSAGTAGPDCSGVISSAGHNLIGDATGCGFTPSTGDVVGPVGGSPIDPRLGPLGSNGGPTQTMALQPGSPAIDLVPTRSCTDANGAALHTDQRGVQRPIGGGCDAGAYEAAGPDELIRLLHGTIGGEDIFNSTGNGQTRKATVAPAGSVTFKVLLQNDGAGPDSFTLKGDGNRTGIGTVRYLAGGTTDITSAIEAGTYVTPTLTPGQQIAIDMVITGDPSVTVAVTGKWLLTAKSVATPTLLDAVAAKVTVKP